MDLAVERGINFFDTAELYPVPATAATYADTERILGTWFKKTGKRDQIVLASKIAGSGDYTAHIRDHEHFSPNLRGFRRKFTAIANRLPRFVPAALARTPHQFF